MTLCYESSNHNNFFRFLHVSRIGSGKRRTRLLTGESRRVGRAVLVVRWVTSSIRGWFRQRATIRTLEALNDHHLSDIGLDRSGIIARVKRDSWAKGASL